MTIAQRRDRVAGPLLDRLEAQRQESAESRAAWDQARADEERRRDEALRRVGWNRPRPDEAERKARLEAGAEAGRRARDAQAAWQTFRRTVEAELQAARSGVDAAVGRHDVADAVEMQTRAAALAAVLARVEGLMPDWRSPALAMHGYEAV